MPLSAQVVKTFSKKTCLTWLFWTWVHFAKLAQPPCLAKKGAQKEVLKHVFQTAKLTKQGLFRLLYSNIWHDTNGIYYCGTVGTIWKIPSKNFWHSLPWRPFGEKWQFFTIHGSQAFNNKNAILMFEMSNVQLQWQLFKYQRLLWSILFSYP